MARLWIPVGILLLCVVGLTLFLQSGEEGASAGDPQSQPSAEQPEAADGLDRRAQDPADQAVQAAPQLERTTLQTVAPDLEARLGEPVEEGGLLITVVDAETEEPLPQADVLVIDTGTADMRLLKSTMATESDFEQVFLELGTLYHTNARAQVRIPTPIGQPFLAGRTAQHFDFVINLGEHLEEYTLPLHPLELLPVMVVDGKGRVVEGAPVSLRVRNDFRVTNLMAVHSDADGIAKLRLFDLLKREIKGDDTFVALQLLASEPVERAIDLDDLPEEMPVLTIPDVGQVEVQLLDEDGSPERKTYMVRLELLELDADGKEAEGVGAWDHPRKSLVVNAREGSALFPLVAFDQMLRISAVSADGERRGTLDARGPIAGGQTAVFQLTPILIRPILVGQLLDADGRPALGRHLMATIRQTSTRNNSSRVHRSTTDAEGRFRILLEEDYKTNAVRTLNIKAEADQHNPESAVVVDISRPFAPGEHDLGSLTFGETPVLVQGIVLDAEKEPVSNAQVRLQQSYEKDGQQRWQGLWELNQRSDGQGRFTVRGIVDPGDYRVVVVHDDHITAHVEVPLGTTDFEVQLGKAMTLQGRFLLDPEVDPAALRLVVTRLDEEGEKDGWPDQVNLEADGSFTLDGMEQGTVNLLLRFEFLEETLFQRDGVAVESKDTTVSLGEFDLRGQLKIITLTVVDPQGQTVENVVLRSTGSYFTRPLKEQPARMVTRDGSLNFLVSAAGYRKVQVADIRSDREIRLTAGIPVRIHVDNFTELPADIAWVGTLRYYPNGAKGKTDNQFDARLEHVGNGVWETSATYPGTYRIQNSLRHKESRGSWSVSSEPFFVEIEESGSVQEFHYRLDPSVLEFARKKGS